MTLTQFNKITQTLFLALLIGILFFPLNLQAETPPNLPNGQALVQAVEKALSNKVVVISETGLTSNDNGRTISGTATFFKKETARITATFSGTDIQAFTAEFDGSFSLKPKHFTTLTGQKIQNWFPGTLTKGMRIDAISLTFTKDDQEVDEMKIRMGVASEWKPVKGLPLNIEQVKAEYESSNMAGRGREKKIARLKGKTSLGRSLVDISGEVESTNAEWTFIAGLKEINLTRVVNTMVGSAGLKGISLPEGVFELDIEKAFMNLQPQQKSLTLTGNSSFGEVEMNISPVSQKRNAKMGFMIGYGVPKGFRYGDLTPVLKPLESIGLENTAFVISSEIRGESELATIKRMGVDNRLNRGLNVLAKYDLRPSGLDRVLKVEQVNVRGAFSNNLNDFLLAGDIDTNIPLGSKATFQRITLNLKPAPGKMEASLAGEIDLEIDNDRLLFTANAGVNAMTQTMFMEGSLNGVWNNPLDIKGLRLEDLWMRMDVSFRTTPIPMPGVGLSGKMKIKKFEGDLTMYVNPATPSQSMLDAGLNHLDLSAILECFVNQQIRQKIPKELKNTLSQLSISNARLTVVPNPIGLTINNKTYDPGFRVKGDANILGLQTHLSMSVDYDNGISAYGEIQAINAGKIFRLTGSRGKPNPFLNIELSKATPPKVQASGLVYLMGISAETDIYLNDNGFEFYTAGKIVNSFAASLTVKGTDLKKSPGFYIKAEMKQDLMDYVTREASKEIDKATKDTQRDFRNARSDLTKWQAELDRLNPLIEKQTKIVQAKRDKDMAKVKVAENAVESARQKVLSVKTAIDGVHGEIKTIDNRVNAKKKWISDAPNVIEKGVRATKASPFFTEQAALRALKMGEIATLETGKATANVTLAGAREALKAVQHLADYTPVELDPSIAPLIASKESAKGFLEAAKLTLSGAEFATVGTLKATKFIVDNGPHQVVKITYAMFEGQLGAVSDGFVRMRFKGTFANRPFDKVAEVHLRNPLNDVIKFADGFLK